MTSASFSVTNIAATKAAVQKFDELLQQITALKREKLELTEIIRENEIKAGLLIDHYKSEIDAQTRAVTALKEELCSRDEVELINQTRDFRDVSTCIEEYELLSKENELFAIINMLEDEIQSLKDDKIQATIEFERKTIDQDVNDIRSRISDSVCDDIRSAIEETIAHNHRLKCEFRLLLRELEKIQLSRDNKDMELTRIKRELELLRQMNELRSDTSAP